MRSLPPPYCAGCPALFCCATIYPGFAYCAGCTTLFCCTAIYPGFAYCAGCPTTNCGITAGYPNCGIATAPCCTGC